MPRAHPCRARSPRARRQYWTDGSRPHADEPDAISGCVFPAHPKVLLSRELYNTTSVIQSRNGCVFDRGGRRIDAVHDLTSNHGDCSSVSSGG